MFDNASSKKNIFSVHVTYKSSGDTNIRASFLTNGHKGTINNEKTYRTNDSRTFAPSKEKNKAGESFYSDTFKSTAGRWEKVVLKPSVPSESKGIYSFQLQLYNSSPDIRQPDNFCINDISIVYRSKGTHFDKGE